MLILSDALNLLSDSIGANRDPVQRLNLAIEMVLDGNDCVGSLELVTFTVTADANGEGFITLPTRYSAIRGAVETTISTSLCKWPLQLRNKWYEYAPGNLGMLKGSDPRRGIIPITKAEGDTLQKYKVPVCPVEGSNAYFTCICKRAFIFQEDDSDVLAVQSIEALKVALKALDKFDAEDFTRYRELKNEVRQILSEETDNETGSEALGKVQVDDDFCVGYLGFEDGCYGYGGW